MSRALSVHCSDTKVARRLKLVGFARQNLPTLTGDLLSEPTVMSGRSRLAPSIGTVLRRAQQRDGLTQRALALRIHKEDGVPISLPYLNDIERDQRNPPSVHLLCQFADALNLSVEHLLFQAGHYPPDLQGVNCTPDAVEAVFQAFRATLAAYGERPLDA